MKQLDLLLPFSLPPAELARDLLRAVQAPSLAMLLARASAAPIVEFDAFARALPHEQWLAEKFGFTVPEESSPPVAAAAMARFGLKPEAGVWFMLQPVHFHITRDHLVLTDTRRLTLSDADARSLFATAQTSFEAVGFPLLYGDAGHWFMRADAWAGLQTATPDAACGHNIDIWMPQGAHARDWRKLQNEVQMDWHAGAVNAAREMQGLKPINSLWLWGVAQAGSDSIHSYDAVANLQGWTRALAPTQEITLSALLAQPAASALYADDTLAEAALGGDWAEWLQRLQLLERDCFAPLLAALKSGRLDELRLCMTHNTRLAQFHVSRNNLRKFWRAPSLSRLAA
jgi:hypothetical protein